jgi:hypothetical protein
LKNLNIFLCFLLFLSGGYLYAYPWPFDIASTQFFYEMCHAYAQSDRAVMGFATARSKRGGIRNPSHDGG